MTSKRKYRKTVVEAERELTANGVMAQADPLSDLALHRDMTLDHIQVSAEQIASATETLQRVRRRLQRPVTPGDS